MTGGFGPDSCLAAVGVEAHGGDRPLPGDPHRLDLDVAPGPTKRRTRCESRPSPPPSRPWPPDALVRRLSRWKNPKERRSQQGSLVNMIQPLPQLTPSLALTSSIYCVFTNPHASCLRRVQTLPNQNRDTGRSDSFDR